MTILWVLLVCFLAQTVLSAQASIKVQAPTIVGLEEQFNLRFVISGEASPSDFSWEASEDFEISWGPSKGTSSSISIINGKTSKSQETTYTYVLKPKSKGHFTINPAYATVKGKKISSSAHQIEVVDDESKSNTQPSTSSRSQSVEISDQDLFMRFSFSKRDVIVGEPITATLKLYKRVNVAGFENVRFPEFNGFWSQELLTPSNLEFERESLDGKIYESAVLRSWTLIPQQSGEIKIDPSELVCLVNIRVANSGSHSIFDSFFQDDYRTIRKRVTTKDINIRVSPLPAGAPKSFGGGVGKYTISASLSRDSLKTHDAASLIVTVRGNGNTSLLQEPKIDFPPDFEVYDVRTKDLAGAKQFEYPFIPRSHGDFVIGPVEYSYLDISSRRYVTLQTEPLSLAVAKGAESTVSNSGQIITSSAQKDVRNLGEDIRFIKTALPSFTAANSFFVGSAAFWLIFALLFILSIVSYFAFRSVAARRADVVGSKKRAALKQARKRLASAAVYLAKDLYSPFYEELHRALLGYVSDKFNMDASEMTKDNISSRFVQTGVSEMIAAEFVGLLDACEFARYAPSTGNEAMNAHYQQGLSLISDIEQGTKRKASGVVIKLALALIMLAPMSMQAQEIETKLFEQEPLSETANMTADQLWNAAAASYTEAEWTNARQYWQKIEAEGFESADLYFNIANAYYREDDIAHAILYYERALRLSPADEDVRFNLELARSKVMDKIELVPEFFLLSWYKTVRSIMGSTAWAVLGLVLMALCLAMLLLFALGGSVAGRRSGFVIALISLVLAISSFSMGFSQKAESLRADKAIVVRAVVSVKSSPSGGAGSAAKDLFVLHEGTKLTILDKLGAWSNVELADGRQGWMLTSELEVI